VAGGAGVAVPMLVRSMSRMFIGRQGTVNWSLAVGCAPLEPSQKSWPFTNQRRLPGSHSTV